MKIATLLRSFAALAALTVGAALVPSTVHAQDAESGPRVTSAGISNVVQSSAVLPGELPPLQDSMGNGRNVAMMVVGGAAIVVGSVVGGDGGQIIMISGAVIGLIGLFRYLR